MHKVTFIRLNYFRLRVAEIFHCSYGEVTAEEINVTIQLLQHLYNNSASNEMLKMLFDNEIKTYN